MAPEHAEVLPLCEVKFQLYDKHLEDAPANRDKIVEHETKIVSIEQNIEKIAKGIDKIRNIKLATILSALAIIVTIVLAAFAAAVYFGRTIEKVERLDRIHQERIER